jgi:hypothetical protein
MSGPGDVGGEVSGDEAAWRDLIARFDSPATQATEAAPWPASEDLPGSDSAAADVPQNQPAETEVPSNDRPTTSYVPPEGTKIIRFARDPRAYSPPEEPDEPFVPEPLPPPARLDPVSKGAWVALVCGPAYLLLGTVLHWSISGTEALAAIAAFITGFVILVVKMGDRPPRDDDDDGAVV